MPRQFQSARVSNGQRGFSMVELSIAMLIALFLLGGLLTLVMGTRRTSSTQTALSQLQDNQRIAMTLITNVVQKAGYFANPTTQALNSASFPPEPALAGVTLPGGQVLGGLYNAAAPGDTLVVRFIAPANDSSANPVIVNCAGQSNTGSGTGVWYTNAFTIGTDASGNPWLQCLVRTSGAGTPLTINLIPNVTQMTVLYGVASSANGDDYSVVQYMNASQVTTSGNWLNITSVKVTLTFQLPAYGTTGGQMTNCATTPQCTSVFTRVIPIMSRAGVDT
ncbi:MAG TPA: PilW family protein [Steroidobacteraceae bacterium]|jgi:type IV pilus assembly protein PilW|nr:PilW family protein [Steroidobacteraceae bacterium]